MTDQTPQSTGTALTRRDLLSVGALVFTLVYASVIAPIVAVADYGKITLPSVLDLAPFPVALVVGALFLVVIRLLPTEVRKAS